MDEPRYCPVQKLTEQDLKMAAEHLEVNPAMFPDLLRGMNVELEHCDFTEGDHILSARIALAHLRERPDYYDKLEKAGL